jgi:hypothetical protein
VTAAATPATRVRELAGVPRVNLDVFRDVAGVVTLGEGVAKREYPVHHVDGETYRLLSLVDEATPDQGVTMRLFDAAARCLSADPNAVPPEIVAMVDRLTAAQVGSILAIAQTPVQQLEKEFPNGSGPTTTSSTGSSA